MKYLRNSLLILLMSIGFGTMFSQSPQSTSTGVTRVNGQQDRRVPRSKDLDVTRTTSNASSNQLIEAPDASVEWMRIIYRELDLDKEKNATLYYPEDVVYGQENLFRIVLHQISEGRIPAYEYLDGREIFTDEFKVNVKDMLDRFHIPYEIQGSNEMNRRYIIDEIDYPSSEVLSYYIIEKWQYDNRSNSTTTTVEAVCPVLHRSGDFGEEAMKYPMFWVSMSDLRPFLMNTSVFVDDFDNNPRYTLVDYFTKNMYDGEIYKTRNVRNRSMAQLYPDEDQRRHAADSIDGRLKGFDRSIWVPSREEILAARDAKTVNDKSKEIVPERQESVDSKRRPSRTSRGINEKNNSGSSNSGSVTRSVRNRKK